LSILSASHELKPILHSTTGLTNTIRRLLAWLDTQFNAHHAVYIEYKNDRVGGHSLEKIIEADEKLLMLSTNIKSLCSDYEIIDYLYHLPHEPQIINNLVAALPLQRFAELVPGRLHRLLISSFGCERARYAYVLLFRGKDEPCFLERERELLFTISLYLGQELYPMLVRRQALYDEVIDTSFQVRTFNAFKHYQRANLLRTHSQPIILIGEEGVGKTHFAKYIYAAMKKDSAKTNKRAITIIDCAYIGGASLSSLFPVKGDGLIIENIQHLSLAQQKYIMKFLEMNKKNMRIFVELRTPRYFNALAQHIIESSYPTIFIEPLRNTPQNIVPLFKHLLRYNDIVDSEKEECHTWRLTPTVEKELADHQWDGNIAELFSVSVHSMKMSLNQDRIIAHIDFLHLTSDMPRMTLKDALNNYKKKYIISVLEYFHGNQTHAAKTLDIERTYLNKLIHMWYKD